MLAYESSKLSTKTMSSTSETASVSIGAKPMSSFALHRSLAMPIALKRPIRKVSFSDLSDLESSTSGIKSAQLRSSSSTSPRSFTLRDAVRNRIPASPACSQHSEVESEDSKVRGGHLYESDQNSSSASLASQDHVSLADHQDAADNSSNHHAQLMQQKASSATHPSRRVVETKPAVLQPAACLSDFDKLNLEPRPAQHRAASPAKIASRDSDMCSTGDSSLSGSSTEQMLSCSGHKTHGGNLFAATGTSFGFL